VTVDASTAASAAQEMTMQLAMIGLGRMGANMARRLMRNGHQCVVYDRSPEAVAALAKEGAHGVASPSWSPPSRRRATSG
jgi:6-phosphogluconate dehydrogenase